MNEKLEPGIYDEAQVVDYGLNETGGGKPQVFIKLMINEKYVTWYGGFHEKQKEHTLREFLPP